MLPQRLSKTRKGTGITVIAGHLCWQDQAGKRHEQTVEVWPATVSRPKEIRLTRIHELNLFNEMSDTNEGRLYLFIIQVDDGTLRAHLCDENIMENSEFNGHVRGFIQRNVGTGRKPARGYIDYQKGTAHPYEL